MRRPQQQPKSAAHHGAFLLRAFRIERSRLSAHFISIVVLSHLLPIAASLHAAPLALLIFG